MAATHRAKPSAGIGKGRDVRSKGEAGTGDVVEAVRHARKVLGEIRYLQNLPEEEVMAFAKQIGAPYELLMETRALGRLPVVNFAAGGIATPADAALMMQLGVDGVFVGSGIFKSGEPRQTGRGDCQIGNSLQRPKILGGEPQPCEPMVGRANFGDAAGRLIAGRLVGAA